MVTHMNKNINVFQLYFLPGLSIVNTNSYLTLLKMMEILSNNNIWKSTLGFITLSSYVCPWKVD